MLKKFLGEPVGFEVPRKDSPLFERIDWARLPRHVAVIMDGNGRWATGNGLIRSAGHTAGVRALKNVLKTAVGLGLEALTVYAFSTENWKRPHVEVDFLLHLFSDYLEREKREMHENGVRIRFLGRVDGFSEGLQRQMREAEDLMRGNKGVRFSIAVNYGGQDELVRAARGLARRVADGTMEPDAINAAAFEEELDISLPVDLMIRTSGDLRLSNFLLWQAAYAEFWFTDTNWPDFRPEDFVDAIVEYGSRDRRFGGL